MTGNSNRAHTHLYASSPAPARAGVWAQVGVSKRPAGYLNRALKLSSHGGDEHAPERAPPAS